ncbi:MAG TPA: tetratricopeptide repeat protein [Thermoanaerobaculia bacterium]
MTNSPASRVDALRQTALAKVRNEEYDEALAIYDEALALATDDDARELLTINKADALIALERSGPEVQQLPTILMRRRNHHHTFLAAYALMYKHRLQNEPKRGVFYGQVALDAAVAAEQPMWRLGALNELGIIYETDSQFDNAIDCFEQALALIDSVSDRDDRDFGRAAVIQNLGYNKLLVGRIEEGIDLILSIIDQVDGPSTLADAHLDLCYGYLELQQFASALRHGEIALEHAVEPRQVRNAHYLLGEAAFKSGDVERAEIHFDELARFYPEFRNLKSLLFAIDIRSMVNFRL